MWFATIVLACYSRLWLEVTKFLRGSGIIFCCSDKINVQYYTARVHSNCCIEISGLNAQNSKFLWCKFQSWILLVRSTVLAVQFISCSPVPTLCLLLSFYPFVSSCLVTEELGKWIKPVFVWLIMPFLSREYIEWSIMPTTMRGTIW